MIVLDRILCVKYCIRTAQNIFYISQILNFNVENSDMPNIKNFRKELNSKNFKKIHFPILKQTQPTIFFDLLGRLLPQLQQFLGLLYVTPHRYLSKRQQFTKMIRFNFLYTDQM